jgi:sugar O-acyltransferase (sialic acid O-acetyltransferase NeuD family)
MKIKKIVIIGGKNSFYEVYPILNSKKYKSKYKITNILDDDKSYFKKNILDIPVSIGLENANKFKDHLFVFAIGSYNNKYSRQKILKKTNLPLDKFPSLIDQSCLIEPSVKIGYGNIVYGNSIICSGSKIENFCLITYSNIIAHNVKILSFNSIGSRTSILNNSIIEDECFIGANVLVGENINVGKRSSILLGTVVLKNIPRKSRVFGNPAIIYKNK